MLPTTQIDAGKRTVLVVGPESTGTRVLTSVLTQHPSVFGAVDAPNHEDVLDEVWRYVQSGDLDLATEHFPKAQGKLLLTRRSMPHGAGPGALARYNDFANLSGFHEVHRRVGRQLELLITVRDPIGNLSSWARSRASAAGDMSRAFVQYQQAYRHVFAFIAAYDVPFLCVPLESLLLGGTDLANALAAALGLPACDKLRFSPRKSVNTKHYSSFIASRFSLSRPWTQDVETVHARAAQALDAPGVCVVEFAPYPHSLAFRLRQATRVQRIADWPESVEAAWARVTSTSIQDDGFVLQTRYRLAVMDLHLLPDCLSQVSIAMMLDTLIELARSAEMVVLSYRPRSRVARLLLGFLRKALGPRRETQLPLSDVGVMSEEPASKLPRGLCALCQWEDFAPIPQECYEQLQRQCSAHLCLVSQSPEGCAAPPYQWNEVIVFRSFEGAAELYQHGPWSRPCQRFTVLGAGANALRIPIPETDPHGPIALTLSLRALRQANGSPWPSLTVYVNGNAAETIDFWSRGVKKVTIPLPQNVWRVAPSIDLSLQVSAPEAAGQEVRLAIEWLTIGPVQ